MVEVHSGGVVLYGEGVVFDQKLNLHRLKGYRSVGKVWNALRTKSAAFGDPGDDVLLGGSFQVFVADPPWWWDVTREQAEASLY